MRERAAAWKTAAVQGRLYGRPEPIPDYDPQLLDDEIRSFPRLERDEATRTLAYRFLEAAGVHRDHLLDVLLPANGLRIESVSIDW